MFSNSADFSNMFDQRASNMHISQVQHKAFIDVNEIGCEAAAASGKRTSCFSLTKPKKVKEE